MPICATMTRAYLEAPLSRMFSTTTEETWRFDAEVANLFFTSVEHALGVRLFHLVLLRLELFLLSTGHGLLGGFLGLEVKEHGSEVALVKRLDLGRVRLS